MTVEREAHGLLDVHTHPVEARALILAGDVFHLAANQAHAESYRPKGVRDLAARK